MQLILPSKQLLLVLLCFFVLPSKHLNGLGHSCCLKSLVLSLLVCVSLHFSFLYLNVDEVGEDEGADGSHNKELKCESPSYHKCCSDSKNGDPNKI